MRRILFVVFIVFSFSARSQSISSAPKDSTLAKGDNYKVSFSNKGSISISGGIAYCTIFLRIYGDDMSGASGTPVPISATPAYSAFVDYGISKVDCIGLAVTYQAVTGTPKFPENIYDTLTCIEQISRLNFGLRYIHYLRSDIASGFYYGARIGISFWTDILPSYLSGDEMMGARFKVLPSVQAFVGYRLVIANHLTFHAEIGLGTPYLLETGLGIKL